MITTFTKDETTQLIEGPTGKLELIVGEPAEETRSAWGIVVSSASPLWRYDCTTKW